MVMNKMTTTTTTTTLLKMTMKMMMLKIIEISLAFVVFLSMRDKVPN
jgi:hypothetical protein